MISKSSLDLTEATRIQWACAEAASGQGAAISVAIVDDAGQLLHFARMDGARPHTVELAMRRARLAASVGVPTAIIADMAARSGGIAGEASVGAGGHPITAAGLVVGAIGISGAKPEIDEMIAAAGLAAL